MPSTNSSSTPAGPVAPGPAGTNAGRVVARTAVPGAVQAKAAVGARGGTKPLVGDGGPSTTALTFSIQNTYRQRELLLEGFLNRPCSITPL
jgi:hypothetical protein